MFLSGVESRLATLTVDMDDLNKLSGISSRPDLPSTFQPQDISQLVTTLPAIFNSLQARRAIIPAANGHCSARALARYYAALVDGGVIPRPHSSLSKPPLGSHPHVPKFSTKKVPKKHKTSNIRDLIMRARRSGDTQQAQNSDNSSDVAGVNSAGNSYARIPEDGNCSSDESSSTEGSLTDQQHTGKVFNNPKIHEAFLGIGEYENLALPNGEYGLGFKRSHSKDDSLIGFGHSGMGGSTGYCDMKNRFAIAVTLNKMSLGSVTGKVIELVCKELDIPLPKELVRLAEGSPADDQFNSERPLIN